jgi:protein-S-isoprenylcysteine O-methyltransferase Ste14
VTVLLAYLLIALLPFICSGDLGWWQAWMFSLLFVLSGVGARVGSELRHPGLMVERMRFGKEQDVKAWDRVLAPLLGITLSLPLIVAGLDHRFGWTSVFPVWINGVGLVMILLGYLFASWALVENQYFSSMVRIQMDRGHKVCHSGPYRFVRHPGYAGSILPLFGIVLALDSLWTLIPVAVAILVIVIRTALEDRVLINELAGYQDYASQVRYRLVPGIW